MTVIARDNLATDHLVYCWPFPIGPECEVACSEDEQVVMCPAWMVGDRLGPGRHRWRTPDPTRPVGAFFVLTAPVEVTFDMITAFVIPQNGQPVRLRAAGSLQVRCADPGLLVAQFVGLPFDQINDGVLRSVRRSLERMLARLLIRRVVMAGTPGAITDPAALPSIVEELVAYNPTAGAVFGVELMRIAYMSIAADDGSTPQLELPDRPVRMSTPPPVAAAPPKRKRPPTPRLEDHPNPAIAAQLAAQPNGGVRTASPYAVTEEESGSSPPAHKRAPSKPPVVSGEIGGKKAAASDANVVSGEIGGKRVRETVESSVVPPPVPKPRRATLIPATDEDGTPQPAPLPPVDKAPAPAPAEAPVVARTKSDGSSAIELAAAAAAAAAAATAHASAMTPLPEPATPSHAKPTPKVVEAPKGAAILGIGMGAIGTAQPVEEKTAAPAVSVGGRVLVPGPNGLMQSATVRQAMQGYYELEIGSTGQTMWVPASGVVPD